MSDLASTEDKAVVQRDEWDFEVEIDLDPDQVAKRFMDRQGVVWRQARGPAGWSAPRYQAWPARRQPKGGRSFYLRAAKFTGRVLPPFILVRAEPTMRGSKVSVRFLREPLHVKHVGRGTLGALLVLTGLIGWAMIAMPLVIPSFLGTGLTLLFGIGYAAHVSLRSNRPPTSSIEKFVPEVWRMLGEVLVPHMLGDGKESPFRARALPSAETGAKGDA